jgi:hypothetical protein
MVVGVGDVNVSGAINSHPLRTIEFCGAAGSSGSVEEPGGSVSGDCGGGSCGCDFADAIGASVGDVNVSVAINSHPLRIIEFCGAAESSGSVEEPGGSVSGECGGVALGGVRGWCASE